MLVISDTPVKKDENKLPMHLIPLDALEEVAAVLKFGATKYPEGNWKRGFAYSRLFGAILRHLYSWFQCKGNDPESGRSHLAHAATVTLQLLAIELRKCGKDDRSEY